MSSQLQDMYNKWMPYLLTIIGKSRSFHCTKICGTSKDSFITFLGVVEKTCSMGKIGSHVIGYIDEDGNGFIQGFPSSTKAEPSALFKRRNLLSFDEFSDFCTNKGYLPFQIEVSKKHR